MSNNKANIQYTTISNIYYDSSMTELKEHFNKYVNFLVAFSATPQHLNPGFNCGPGLNQAARSCQGQ